MNPEMESNIILPHEEALEYYCKYTVTYTIDLKNGKELISYFEESFDNEYENKSFNISIPIATAVTTYSRVHMSQFKTMKDLTLYYTDTDSIDTNKPLDFKFIGNDLGKMKLEHTFTKAIFLAPKVYGGITPNYEYVKIKGVKNPIHFNELFNLLNKDYKL